MNHEFLLKVSATLGAHERLITDLLINFALRTDDPIKSADEYAEGLKAKLTFVETPGLDPAESDHVNQMIGESLEKTLTQVQRQVRVVLGRANR
jgi:hypothetical protein